MTEIKFPPASEPWGTVTCHCWIDAAGRIIDGPYKDIYEAVDGIERKGFKIDWESTISSLGLNP